MIIPYDRNLLTLQGGVVFIKLCRISLPSPSSLLHRDCNANISINGIYSFLTFFDFKSNPLTSPTKMKNKTKCKCAFSFALIIPSLNEVFKNKCTSAEPRHAVIIGYAIPFTIGSSPLFKGKNAPPHPETVPHIIGPNSGNENREGAIAAFPASVKVRTTFALTHS